ncbi:hypothetical protein [Paenibacillus koleovorans]|uniref:hypothetical protein n=1 Tax=Paenibacillus koleovorans TaxID=121608 RepID=UPI000FD9F545|nr:hypothetical protein [Paenibacillus koleovorans]
MSAATTQRTTSLEINLLQLKPEDAKKQLTMVPVVLLVVVALSVVTMGWLWISSNKAVKKADAELVKVNAEIKDYQARLASSPTLGGVTDFIGLPAALKSSRPNPAEVLDKLSALMPAASNMTTLTFGDGNTLKVTGNFASTEDVVTFMQAAKASASFTLTGTSGMTKVALPVEGTPPATSADVPMPVIQATFDLMFKPETNKKG